MAKRSDFLVQGSTDEPYRVTFELNGSMLSAYCTCRAGEIGQHCKHRINLLKGDTTAVVSDNLEEAAVVASWLPGTDVDSALKNLRNCELALEDAKKAIKQAKKELAAAFRS